MNPVINNRTDLCFLFLVIIFAISPIKTIAQHRIDSVNQKRLNTFLIGTGAAYSISLVALNQLWYSDHPKQKFHFFDDSGEWKQMDKVGHFYSSFHLGLAGSKAFRWTGMTQKKSLIFGSILGFALLMPIELMDGFSSEYGASGSDLAANFLGTSFLLGQDLIWREVRIKPKFSFSASGLPDYRPEILGKNKREQLFKDYNGQTYWLAFDINSLTGFKPKWINIALGYGVQNMINSAGNPTPEFPFKSFRQYYLAIDFDLSHLESKSGVVNTLLYFVDLIHLPAPALEYNTRDKIVFHPLHF